MCALSNMLMGSLQKGLKSIFLVLFKCTVFCHYRLCLMGNIGISIPRRQRKSLRWEVRKSRKQVPKRPGQGQFQFLLPRMITVATSNRTLENSGRKVRRAQHEETETCLQPPQVGVNMQCRLPLSGFFYLIYYPSVLPQTKGFILAQLNDIPLYIPFYPLVAHWMLQLTLRLADLARVNMGEHGKIGMSLIYRVSLLCVCAVDNRATWQLYYQKFEKPLHYFPLGGTNFYFYTFPTFLCSCPHLLVFQCFDESHPKQDKTSL